MHAAKRGDLMRRQPTKKSRTVALLGFVCILLTYYAFGWTTIPGFIPWSLVLAAIVAMFVARAIREQDGQELIIPDKFKNKISKLSNIEGIMAIISGLSVMASLSLVQLGIPKVEERVAFVSSGIIFLVNLIVIVVVDTRYKAMIRNSVS